MRENIEIQSWMRGGRGEEEERGNSERVCVWGREGRERQRERDREIQGERETERQTDIHRETQRGTEIEIQRETAE